MAEPPPHDLLLTHVLAASGPRRVLVRRDWQAALPLEGLLAGQALECWGTPVPHDLAGRGAVHVLATERGQVVAKGASRGGLLAAFLPDLFLDGRRVQRGAALAEALASRGCPTPALVAGRVTRVLPLLHRLETATARVPGAVDLLVALRGCDDPAPLAALAGRTLRRLHDVGLRHRDLQVKNLLVPAEGAEAALAVVIDLDGCSLGAALSGQERAASLARFARSLVKRNVLPAVGALSPTLVRAVTAFWRHYACSACEHSAQVGRAELSARSRRLLARQLHRRGWARRAVRT